jgi:DNA polymerase-3 subunit gamma/tau
VTARHHQALYRRWRAQTFGEIVGQEPVVATLRNAVRSDQVSHALLFVGPRGTGKTSMARIVAKALNCTSLADGEPCDTCPACNAIREGRALDVIEMDAASHNRVDDMRDLLRGVATGASDLQRKVYVVDEVQRIKEGWDVLLKTLEEPPDHVTFIFCTTDASQVRPAVLSRVQRFDFRPLTAAQIEGKLRRVLEAEERAADDDAIDLVARLAAGGMRDAESMLDQLLTAGRDPLTSEQVRELLGIVESETVDAFVAALADTDPLAGLRILDALEERGRDLRGFMNQVVEALRGALVRALTSPGSSASATAALAAAARRLAAIDPARSGAGGLRFQLELALLAPAPTPSAAPAAAGAVASVAPAAVAVASPSPLPPRPEPRRAEPAPPSPAAKPAAAQPPAAASPVASAGSAGLEELVRHWPAILAGLSQSPVVKPLITICRPIAVDGNVVTLGFPESQGFLKDALERRRTTIEEGITLALGRAVAVRCVATNIDVRPAPDPDAERLLAEAQRIFGDVRLDVGEVS